MGAEVPASSVAVNGTASGSTPEAGARSVNATVAVPAASTSTSRAAGSTVHPRGASSASRPLKADRPLFLTPSWTRRFAPARTSGPSGYATDSSRAAGATAAGMVGSLATMPGSSSTILAASDPARDRARPAAQVASATPRRLGKGCTGRASVTTASPTYSRHSRSIPDHPCTMPMSAAVVEQVQSTSHPLFTAIANVRSMAPPPYRRAMTMMPRFRGACVQSGWPWSSRRRRHTSGHARPAAYPSRATWMHAASSPAGSTNGMPAASSFSRSPVKNASASMAARKRSASSASPAWSMAPSMPARRAASRGSPGATIPQTSDLIAQPMPLA